VNRALRRFDRPPEKVGGLGRVLAVEHGQRLAHQRPGDGLRGDRVRHRRALKKNCTGTTSSIVPPGTSGGGLGKAATSSGAAWAASTTASAVPQRRA
jgi:hypothetical protein